MSCFCRGFTMNLYTAALVLGAVFCTGSNTIIPELTCTIGDGGAYRGTIAKTQNGRTCQRWTDQTPHSHKRTPANYPGKGLVNNYCRNIDNEARPWCYTTDPNVRWEYCNIPNCGNEPGNNTIIPQLTCTIGDGGAYRGTIAYTRNGKTCQRWTDQTPHSHKRTPANYPGKGLVNNYCRNIDNEARPWCYTTDPNVRWEYCNIPNCGNEPGNNTIIPELTCTISDGGAYRGTIAVTWNGKTCQRWTDQTPHSHKLTPANYPGKGLVNNYCRNPNNGLRPWCYTTDPNARWEFCSIPSCGNEPGRPFFPELTCATGNGEAYRGTTAVTESGKTCQRWSSQTPHSHKRTHDNYPGRGLENNYCRNIDNEARPWCYTTDPNVRWEYCSIPSCENGPGGIEINFEDFHFNPENIGRFTTLTLGSNTITPELTCTIGDGGAYRGTIAVTWNGKTCQRWTDQTPHSHKRTPANYPGKGLVNNYCRNIDNEARPWCYTTDPNARWEYCSIPSCGNEPGRPFFPELTCATGNGEAYRGMTAVTESGKTCQRWSSQTPHSHKRTHDNYPGRGLENNYCRNIDNEARPWCYTTDPNVRWEYCSIPSCGN